jgi:long-chain acyl-CoA synthetase
MRKYDDPRLMFIADLEASGQAALDRRPRTLRAHAGFDAQPMMSPFCARPRVRPRIPKLAEWTHHAFLGHAAAYLEADPKGADDEYCRGAAALVGHGADVFGWLELIARMKVNFPEEQATVMADLREIGPTFLLLAPRVWEQIAADVRARMMDSSAWKAGDLQVGRAARSRGRSGQGKRSWLADKLLFSALRDRLGFKNLTSAATGGAAMGPDTFKFFLAMRVPPSAALRADRGARCSHHPPRRRRPS